MVTGSADHLWSYPVKWVCKGDVGASSHNWGVVTPSIARCKLEICHPRCFISFAIGTGATQDVNCAWASEPMVGFGMVVPIPLVPPVDPKDREGRPSLRL